jgi:hypothetical protein
MNKIRNGINVSVGGRKKKYTAEKEREIAGSWLDKVRRNDGVSQKEYASTYGISAKTLRNYAMKHYRTEYLILRCRGFLDAHPVNETINLTEAMIRVLGESRSETEANKQITQIELPKVPPGLLFFP